MRVQHTTREPPAAVGLPDPRGRIPYSQYKMRVSSHVDWHRQAYLLVNLIRHDWNVSALAHAWGEPVTSIHTMVQGYPWLHVLTGGNATVEPGSWVGRKREALASGKMTLAELYSAWTGDLGPEASKERIRYVRERLYTTTPYAKTRTQGK